MKTFFEWALRLETRALEPPALLVEYGRLLRERGVPIHRLTFVVRPHHPQVGVWGITWTYGDGVSELRIPRDRVLGRSYEESPIKAIHDGTPEVRCLLVGPDADLRYPICHDLLKRDFTDYIGLPVRTSVGEIHFLSMGTKAEGGFPDAALDLIRATREPLELLLELSLSRVQAEIVCTTYIGPRAGREVLRGEITRGNVRHIYAALWFCDLRGFTALSERLDDEPMIALLNGYLDAVGEAVAAHDGEILKIIGDAALAVFPFARQDAELYCAEAREAADRAVEAARHALRNVEALTAPDDTPLRAGVGVHLGRVGYGNIGAAERLDFTVVGPAVNLASRIEGLCSPLGEPLLMSEAVAKATRLPTRAVGTFALRGIEVPAAVFAPEVSDDGV